MSTRLNIINGLIDYTLKNRDFLSDEQLDRVLSLIESLIDHRASRAAEDAARAILTKKGLYNPKKNTNYKYVTN